MKFCALLKKQFEEQFELTTNGLFQMLKLEHPQ